MRDCIASMWRQLIALAGVLIVPLAQAQAQQTTDGTLLRAPDHVLVWSQRAGAAARVFEDLGFPVRAGRGYPEGITNSTILFSDWSYLELLHFSDPAKAAGKPQPIFELAFAGRGPGANSFAIQVRNVEAATDHLRRQGFSVADVLDSGRVASWRDFHLASSPVSGVELFFIEYPPDPAGNAGE